MNDLITQFAKTDAVAQLLAVKPQDSIRHGSRLHGHWPDGGCGTTLTAKSCCDDVVNPRASVDALCYYRASVAVLSDLNACPSGQDRSTHEM
jgi:hypothetical protein